MTFGGGFCPLSAVRPRLNSARYCFNSGAGRQAARRGDMFGPIIGVLFDGFAYGMLLFLLSVGLSVTLGMMNFVNLAHCAFAMLGGYVTVTLANTFRLAVPCHAADGVPRRGAGQRRARAHAVPQALSRQRSRSGAADDRSRLHVDRERGLYLRHRPAAVADARLPARLGASISASISRSIACSWSRSGSRSRWCWC